MRAEVERALGNILDELGKESLDMLKQAYNLKDDNALRALMVKTAEDIIIPEEEELSIEFHDLFQARLEESFRCSSLAYFIVACMEGFDLNWHHLQWCQLVQKHKRLCVLSARNHGKSHLFSFAYPLWRMYRHRSRGEPFYNRNLNANSEEGMVITNESSLSMTFITKIIEEIENNPILKERLYPSNFNSPTRLWGKKGITCKNGARLLPFSAKGRIRGRHPNWLVLDDYLDDSSLYSPEQREKAIEAFSSAVLNTLQPKGQVIVVGTPFHKSDLYGDLRTRKAFKYYEYPAIYPTGQVLWPDRFSLNDLIALKEDKKDDPMSEVRFSREYLVRPVDSNQTIFPHYLIGKALKPEMDFIYNKGSGDYSKYEAVITGCDFAISSGIGADYTVYITVAKETEGRYRILHIYREKGVRYNEQITRLRDLFYDLEPDKIVMENNGFQESMAQAAEDEGLPIERHTTTASNKFSLAQGIPMVAALFEKGIIDIPHKEGESRRLAKILINELASFTWSQGKILSTAAHDDMVLALWIAVKALRDSEFAYNLSYVDTR